MIHHDSMWWLSVHRIILFLQLVQCKPKQSLLSAYFLRPYLHCMLTMIFAKIYSRTNVEVWMFCALLVNACQARSSTSMTSALYLVENTHWKEMKRKSLMLWRKSCFIGCQLRLAAQHKAVASVSRPHSEVVQQLELGVALNALNAWSQGVLSTNGFLRGAPRELYSVSFIPWLCVDWHGIFNIFQYVLRWLWNIDPPMIRWSTYDQPLRRSPLSRLWRLEHHESESFLKCAGVKYVLTSMTEGSTM